MARSALTSGSVVLVMHAVFLVPSVSGSLLTLRKRLRAGGAVHPGTSEPTEQRAE